MRELEVLELVLQPQRGWHLRGHEFGVLVARKSGHHGNAGITHQPDDERLAGDRLVEPLRETQGEPRPEQRDGPLALEPEGAFVGGRGFREVEAESHGLQAVHADEHHRPVQGCDRLALGVVSRVGEPEQPTREGLVGLNDLGELVDRRPLVAHELHNPQRDLGQGRQARIAELAAEPLVQIGDLPG